MTESRSVFAWGEGKNGLQRDKDTLGGMRKVFVYFAYHSDFVDTYLLKIIKLYFKWFLIVCKFFLQYCWFKKILNDISCIVKFNNKQCIQLDRRWGAFLGCLHKYRTDLGHAVSPFWLILKISKHYIQKQP